MKVGSQGTDGVKYRIYIDEVGNPDLESSDNPNHRYLSLTGVILELDYVQTTLHPQLEALKLKHFRPHPDEPIILHRKEMIHAVEPFAALADDALRGSFDVELLGLLQDWRYSVVTVCLDKKRHKTTYSTWRYDPYHYCLAVMLERYLFFLDDAGARGDIMAEARGGKADMRLKASFERLWQSGTEFVEAARFQARFTSRQLKVKPKAVNVAGLQLADLLAHPSRDEILTEQGLLTKPQREFARKVVAILRSKYYVSGGTVYGKKFI
jgi:hypothetical protein